MKSTGKNTQRILRNPGLEQFHERLREGDHDAMEALVTRFWSAVMRYCWVRVAVHDAHDLTQEVFLSVYQTVRRGGGPQSDDLLEWRRYLMSAARNRIIDYYRRKRTEPPVQLQTDLGTDEHDPTSTLFTESGSHQSDQSLLSQEQQQAIHVCMGGLDVVSRMMCWFFFVEGKSKREIGRLMQTPESSVRKSMADAIQSLRRCLETKGAAPA